MVSETEREQGASVEFDMTVSQKKLSVPALALMGVYLLWQILFPLRHHLIAGDARMTFEGLSFSWRLKAEVYRAAPVDIFLEDRGIVTELAEGRARIDWKEWSGPAEIYCQADPENIDWRRLPEIVVLFEADLGDRVFYNPLGLAEPPVTLAEAQTRILELWQRHFGRRPSRARTILSVESVEQSYREALLQKHNIALPESSPALELFLRKHGRQGDGNGLAVLRRLPPFSGKSVLPEGSPFIVIEDEALFVESEGHRFRVARDAWSELPEAIPDPVHPWQHENAQPLIVYTADFEFQLRNEFPQACLVYGKEDTPTSAPRISWDYHRSLGPSKGMHISTQPFLLRRYARQLASNWEALTGRKPGVYAKSYVSLNFRNMQPMVDETVNLAEAPVQVFRHNKWIHQLRQPRIRANRAAGSG